MSVGPAPHRSRISAQHPSAAHTDHRTSTGPTKVSSVWGQPNFSYPRQCARENGEVTELDLTVRWRTGARLNARAPDPPIQVHRAAENTVILRQSIGVHYEAPFIYLLFGNDRALLLDTGATSGVDTFPLRETVDALMNGWLARHPRVGYELVVAHSHAHGDHVAADGQFADRAFTRVVGHTAQAVAGFFGIHDWPRSVGHFDLGGRVLDVIPTPGHHASAITLYDAMSGVLLSGDTVYPGRLYVEDFPAFEASLRTLCDFVDAHPVTSILGAHIEMSTTPRRDFPIGSQWHPNEAPLPLTVDQLRAIRDAAAAVADRPGAHRFAHFALWNGPCRSAVRLERRRLLAFRVFGR